MNTTGLVETPPDFVVAYDSRDHAEVLACTRKALLIETGGEAKVDEESGENESVLTGLIMSPFGAVDILYVARFHETGAQIHGRRRMFGRILGLGEIVGEELVPIIQRCTDGEVTTATSDEMTATTGGD